jgi:hypothetical protein
VRLLRRIGWSDAGMAVAMALLAALVLRQAGDDVARMRWGDLLLAALACFVSLSHLLKMIWRFAFTPPEELGTPWEEFDGRMDRTRKILPEDPPPGWTAPVRARGEVKWDVDTGNERVSVALVKRGGVFLARVVVAPREGQAPVSDARCLEALRAMRGMPAFVEAEPFPASPEARVWLAMLPESRLPVKVPAALPAPQEPELSPHLVAARKHLPDKLPFGWSVPMAVTSDHGTEWRDGAWAFGVDHEQLVLACLCTSKGRVKLMVAIIRGDGTRASESDALEVLKHFRGVLEFVETPGGDDAPGSVLYLGELRPGRSERAALN